VEVRHETGRSACDNLFGAHAGCRSGRGLDDRFGAPARRACRADATAGRRQDREKGREAERNALTAETGRARPLGLLPVTVSQD